VPLLLFFSKVFFGPFKKMHLEIQFCLSFHDFFSLESLELDGNRMDFLCKLLLCLSLVLERTMEGHV
jgi:hypothetical protein